MRIVIAPDSFKECASAAQVAEAIATGIRRMLPNAQLAVLPMADGGEGTVDAVIAGTGGKKVTVEVTGPLGRPVQAVYGLFNDGRAAVIEMASASGLGLVPPERRDPRMTTTRGTGELMRHALNRDVRRMILGIGGSATNDGGAGMAQALGFGLKDADGAELEPGGAALARLSRIEAAQVHPGLQACEIQVACDVTNPLCGPLGASHVYGPQKGATASAAHELDAALRHFGEVLEWQLGVHVLDLPGAGAAGGLGAGLVAFAGARLLPGVELVAEVCDLDGRMCCADLAITGEGALDSQTAHGKTPLGVAKAAKRYRVPVVALAGTLAPGHEVLYNMGIDAAFSICPGPMTLEDAMKNAESLIARTAEAVIRTWLAARG